MLDLLLVSFIIKQYHFLLLKCKSEAKIYELKGKTTRLGLNKCGNCRKQFTVRIGTIFEESHIPLHKWLPS